MSLAADVAHRLGDENAKCECRFRDLGTRVCVVHDERFVDRDFVGLKNGAELGTILASRREDLRHIIVGSNHGQDWKKRPAEAARELVVDIVGERELCVTTTV